VSGERIPTAIVHVNDQTDGDAAAAPFGGVPRFGYRCAFRRTSNIDAFTDTR